MSSGATYRVLFVENSTEGIVGGSHRSLESIIRNLSPRFVPRVILYSENAMGRALERDGIGVHIWDPPRRFKSARDTAALVDLVFRIARCRLFLKTHEIDLIHLNNSPLRGFMDWLPAARLVGIPCISHTRGRATKPPRTAAGRRLVKRFDRVLATSEHARDSIVAAGVPATTVEVAYDGIDADEFRARVKHPPAEIRADLRVAPDAYMVVMVGHIRFWKGQHVAIEAFRLLPEDLRNRVYLFLVGSCPEESDYLRGLEESISENGLGDRVRYLGESDRVASLMNAADVVLHASIDPEPGGFIFLEAMALGKPTVASRWGAPPEILSPGCAVFYDPARPEELSKVLEELLADPERRRALGDQGRKRVERFTIASNVAEIEAVYTDVLSRSKVARQGIRPEAAK